jgi:mono/diheme cytochrome c family protein
MKSRLLLSVGILFLANTAYGQQGDVRRGHALARQICAECHAVEKNIDVSPNVRAPTFRDVAARPGISDLALYAAVRTPHPAMPQLVPDSSELRDIIAYIRFLAREE